MFKKKIVVFETDLNDQNHILDVLEKLNHEVILLDEQEGVFRQINEKDCDLVVIGADARIEPALDLLKNIKNSYPHLRVIIIASAVNARDAVTAMKLGADDFFIKPMDLELIKNFSWPADLPKESVCSSMDTDPFAIITRDAGMEDLLRVAGKVSDSRASVLIQGASGTGKELVAKYIHNCSRRRNKPFVAINCAALPESLLESELFGHEKGTFTGALARKKGKFEHAHGGTLLLDEIGEMDYSLQAKLLRVLQERVVDRIGGMTPVPVDVRILATTNADLEEMVRGGRFREDLYYRLNVIPLRLPPLEERREDIPLLAEHFIKKYNKIDGKDVKGLTLASVDLLMNRSWPGNVRELENVIERALLMAEGTLLELKDFSLAGLQRSTVYSTPPSFMPVVSLKEMEEKVIFQTLDHTNDNRTHAAKILGISVRTLRNKLNEYKEKMEIQ